MVKGSIVHTAQPCAQELVRHAPDQRQSTWRYAAVCSRGHDWPGGYAESARDSGRSPRACGVGTPCMDDAALLPTMRGVARGVATSKPLFPFHGYRSLVFEFSMILLRRTHTCYTDSTAPASAAMKNQPSCCGKSGRLAPPRAASARPAVSAGDRHIS